MSELVMPGVRSWPPRAVMVFATLLALPALIFDAAVLSEWFSLQSRLGNSRTLNDFVAFGLVGGGLLWLATAPMFFILVRRTWRRSPRGVRVALSGLAAASLWPLGVAGAVVLALSLR